MRKLFLSVVALLCAATSVMAQLNPMEPIAIDKDVRIGKLPNGLTYYIRHNEKPKGQADFYIRSDVGAIQEADNQQGLAHFLEHMAFNGTKNLPGKTITEYLEKVGVRFGYNLNANTSWDVTNYMIKDVPVAREGVIDTALLILHDWSSFIEPQPAEIDAERGVIKEELRTRDNAGWRSTLESIKAVGKDTRYAERNLIGYLDYLESFEYDALTSFYHSWYRPDYQVVVIVGDIDVDQIEKKLVDLMSDLPAPAADAPQKEVIYATQNERPIVSIFTDPEMKGTSLNYFIKHEAVPKEQNGLVVAEIMNIAKAYISMMQNERLSEIAMQPDAPFTSGYQYIGSYGIIPTLENLIYGINTKDGELNRGFETLVAEMEKTRRYGFTLGEFERAKANLLQMLEQQYNNRNDQTNGHYVDKYLAHYSEGAAIPDAETEYQLDKMLVEMLTVNDINGMVQQLFTPNNQIITVNAPEKEGLVAPTEEEILAVINSAATMDVKPYEDNVVKVPLIDPSVKLKGSKVKKEKKNEDLGTTEWTLKNGIQVVVRPSTFKADEVILSAQTFGGLALLSDEDFHTGEYLSMILGNSGVSTFSATELSKQLSGKNASAGITASNYTAGLYGNSSVKDVETMLQLAYLNYTAPRFDETDFNTIKGQYYDYAKNAQSDPDFIFSQFITESIYNKNPRRQSISTEVLDAISFERMPAVFNTMFGNAETLRFIITGNVDLETLKPLVEKYIGSLPTKGNKSKLFDDGVSAAKGQVEKQINVKMSQPKVSVLYYSNSDYKFDLKNQYVAKYLAEALNNRYLTSIREEKGGTYGVGVNVNLNAVPNPKLSLVIQFDTNEVQADELCEIVVDELEMMAENGPTEEQMSKTREFMVKDFNNKLEQNNAWVNKISNFYNFDYNEATETLDVINSVTVDDVKEMMKAILESGNMTKLMMRPEASEK